MVEKVSPIGQAVGLASGMLELRERIADPNEIGVVPSAGRAVCRALASTGFSDIPLANRSGPGFACQPYWENEGIDAPVENPPFTGGQCPTVYEVSLSAQFDRFDGTSGSGTFERNLAGPIEGTFIESGDFNGPNQRWGIIAQGEKTVVGFGSCPPNTTRACYTSVDITSVVRVDGQPDDCGDPPGPSVPGPSNPGTPFGTPQPISIGDDVVNITVNPPQIDLSGSTFFPVNIDVGGVSLSPTINIKGTIGPPSLPAEPQPPAEDGPEVTPSDDAGEVEDEPTEEEEDRKLETIGYKWRLTGLPDNIGGFVGTNPLVFPRPYGNIQLIFEDADGNRSFSAHLPIEAEQGSLIRAEASLKVRGVRYHKLPSIGGITLTPIRARSRDVQ